MEIPEMVEIRKDIKEIKDMIIFVATTGKTVLDVNDIARMEDVSLSSIKHGTYKYLLPRFGQSAYPDGKARWPIEEYMQWRGIPATQRKSMYQEHVRRGAQRILSQRRSKQVS